MTEWIPRWEKNGWKTAKGTDVLNKEQMIRLNDLCKQIKIQWVRSFVFRRNDYLKYSNAGFTHADFVGRLKIFKISSKIQAKIGPKSVRRSHCIEAIFFLEFAWSISKIGRQSWRV